MTDEVIVRARQNCCRLCLAPDSECVPILTSLAADKEPLPSKIHACVNVKVNQSDRLSLRICHSCISFLNSWQSFKNRCLAAQMKQMNWLEMAKSSMRRQIGQMQHHQSEKQQTQQQQQHLLQMALGEKQSNQNKATGRPMPFPIVIKDEPIDEEADAQERAAMRMNLDPEEFLENGGGGIVPKQEVEEESLLQPSRLMNEEPQILTSLGLTQIRRVNPYSQMHNGREQVKSSSELASTRCRFCHTTFSTATNARRHERNVHRNAETTIEPTKLYIKPTTPRSLLKPMQSTMTSPPPLTLLKAGALPPTVTPEMMGIYDYDKPEKYRHLLTDSKIIFLRKHHEFLEQYQNMTCICCPQTFSTYKTFMAHMRRKYPNLARNLCFKCLKQFQSKTTFVAHLRKRNCLNLFKTYHADSGIPKTGPLSSPEKMGTKELLNNKVYECKLCTKEFRLKLDFRSHVYEAHGDHVRKDGAPGQCGFCNAELEDPLLRRRHYNNMECIVVIRCGTCKERFDFHQQFIDHVYENHLPSPVNNNELVNVSGDSMKLEHTSNSNISYSESFNSRLPHSCNICGQTYNNYYNVLRHMEAKHPDQVPKRYICEKCNAGFSRQGQLRDHMYEVHATTLTRSRRDVLSCRMCCEQSDTREKWIRHQTELHSRYTCCYCTYQTKSLDDFNNHIEIHPQLAVKNVPIPLPNTGVLSITNGGNEGDDEEEDEFVNPAKKPKLETAPFQCSVCHIAFSGNVALSNHMRAHYTHDGIANPNTLKNTSTPILVEPKNPSEPHRIRCHLCSRRFTAKTSYRRHMLEEHQIRNITFIKCGICKAEYTHERGLKIHMYKAHGTAITNETTFNASYECDICDSEFKSEKSLNQHKGMVHKNREKEPDHSQLPSGVSYWYQCHYCPANFDTNKKLAIHINSHNEFDSTDYSCKDCGNVYNGRKSLWVHRYKKHPQVADPSSCEICNKLFFTSKMLENHIKESHNGVNDARNQRTNVGEQSIMIEANVEATTNEDHEDDEEEENAEEETFQGKVHCTVCNEEFTDQDLFDKHMETHQIDLYSDNPLAAMFDTGPDDPNQFFMSCMSDNGAYACDICPKTFPALTALKVHRNWHFRTDSKQPSSDLKMRLMIQKKKSMNMCEFCDTGFSSASNLRRHIAEVHNRDSMNNPDRAKMFMDKFLECTRCSLKFEKKAEWVKHKLGHAKDSHSSAFEWGCEICGKIVSRKERLLQHMNSHLKSNGDDDGNASIMSEDQSNSQDSIYSSNTGRQSAVGKPTTGDDDEADEGQSTNDGKVDEKKTKSHDRHVNGDDNEEDESEDDDDDDDRRDNEDDDDAASEDDEGMQYDEDSSQQYQEVDPNQDDIQDEEEEAEEEDDDEEDDHDNIGSYSCDLCQVYFETSKQLRRHVTSHFLNGPGSVTLTEIPKDKQPSKVKIGDDVTTITPV